MWETCFGIQCSFSDLIKHVAQGPRCPVRWADLPPILSARSAAHRGFWPATFLMTPLYWQPLGTASLERLVSARPLVRLVICTRSGLCRGWKVQDLRKSENRGLGSGDKVQPGCGDVCLPQPPACWASLPAWSSRGHQGPGLSALTPSSACFPRQEN